MNEKLHVLGSFLRDNLIYYGGLLVGVCLRYYLRRQLPRGAGEPVPVRENLTNNEGDLMEIINKEISDGIKIEIMIAGGELKIMAAVGLAHLAQKLDDSSDNVIVSALAQMAKALAEKA